MSETLEWKKSMLELLNSYSRSSRRDWVAELTMLRREGIEREFFNEEMLNSFFNAGTRAMEEFDGSPTEYWAMCPGELYVLLHRIICRSVE